MNGYPLLRENNFVQTASVLHERLQAPACIFKKWCHPLQVNKKCPKSGLVRCKDAG